MHDDNSLMESCKELKTEQMNSKGKEEKEQLLKPESSVYLSKSTHKNGRKL